MSNVFVKPALDAAGEIVLVRDPASLKPLDASGEWKPSNQFWARRIRDGDVIEVEPELADEIAPASSSQSA